ncbi:MAG TPA: MoaD/ThiS family protein [Candidatus Binataceae bacterium]|nr:MoaD/ThiS family protein [Candidatus Binataceae bacterium]
MPTVIVPALLRKFTGGVERVQVSGRNLREIIDDLERRFPGMSAHLLDDGELNGSVVASIDGEIDAAGIQASVNENSEVYFLPALGGGIT